MRRRQIIEVGQHYQEPGRGYLGRPAPIWVVEAVFNNAVDALGYARVACTAEPSLRKTIALAVLGDRRRFVPVVAAAGPAAAGQAA
jgi:hypothetical protein